MSSRQISQEIIQLRANLCSALSDPNRLSILYELADQPRNVSELVNLLKLSQPAVSRSLKKLRDQWLVKTVRDGPNVIYHLTDKRLIEALDIVHEILRDRMVKQARLLEGSEITE